MKLFKPNWVSHNGQPIFSIDIHPDGSRFATGGQGDGGSSGKVIVWNMTPVCNSEDEFNADVPKVLCIMENHLACVNSVRWSCNGRYLASGGDDRLIMIWQFAGYGGAGVFGGSSNLKSTTGERWRCSHTLKGHTGDVLDLAWSPGNQWLASCSIDNTVVIWNVEKFPEITTVLKGHTSLVKGVTWDPIGSYIASQSDDKTVKIWKTLDWKLETTIKEPFEECTATTHVLRLSWSPDGGYLVSAHAMNNSGPTAQIIERAGWKTEMDFVGHRKAITCTRFNGCVFCKPTPSQSNDETKSQASLPYTCCAVGSRDRSLSVWLTSLRRPLVVIHDLFENSVMDISWSFTGYSLLCCSWDGTVAMVEFDPGEIGVTLTQEEKKKLHKETYGKTSAFVSQPVVIENPAMLAIQEKKSDQPFIDGVSKAPANPIKYPTEQIETRTSTGRRRIIPVFVAPQEALGGVPKPFGSSSAFGKISSNLIKSARIDSNTKAEVSPAKSVDKSASSSDEKLESLNDISPKKTTSGNRVSDLISASDKQGDPQTQSKTSPQKELQDRAQKKKADLDSRLSEKTKRVDGSNKQTEGKTQQVVERTTPKSISKELLKSAHASPLEETSPASHTSPRGPGRPPLNLKRKHITTASSPGRKRHKQMRKEHSRSFLANQPPTHLGSTDKELPASTPPSKQPPSSHKSTIINLLPVSNITRRITAHHPQKNDVEVVAENEVNSEGKIIPYALHSITCTHDKHEEWSTVMSSPVRCLHGSNCIVGVACHDHSLHVLSIASGRRVFPPLCFGSTSTPIAKIFCRGHHLMAIDASCHLYVWDTKNGKVVVNNSSFAHLVSDTLQKERTAENSPLRCCSLTEHGLPLITLQDDKTFAFNVDLSIWIFVSSSSDYIELYSENVALATTFTSHMTDHEREIFSSSSKKLNYGTGAHAARSFHATPSTQRNATLSLLEHKVATCIMLQSISEYRKWLLAYVRYLVQENLELRLREVCDDLIGPPSQRHGEVFSQGKSWKSHVLGIQKRALLQEEVLPIIGSNLSFQRLYTEYQDQLDNVQVRHRLYNR